MRVLLFFLFFFILFFLFDFKSSLYADYTQEWSWLKRREYAKKIQNLFIKNTL